MKYQYSAPMKSEELKDGSSIADILSLAYAWEEQQDYEEAHLLFDRATSCCTGMLAHARFLLSVPKLEKLTRTERIAKAAQLLHCVEETGNEDQMQEACLMLAKLYRSTSEIRSLAFLVRANNLSGNGADTIRGHLLKQFARLEIAGLEDDPYGCYIAGVECASFSGDPVMLKWALYFLETAAQKGVTAVSGLAAMQIADLYDTYAPDSAMRAHYLEAAAENGNPDVLTLHPRQSKAQDRN